MACALFLAVALVCGGLALLHTTLRTWRLALTASRWPATSGRVLASRVVKDTSGEGVRYTTFISYEYAVARRTYYAERYSFATEIGNTEERVAQTRCAKYPVGATVAVHYDPADPYQAVLVARPTSIDLYVLNCFLGAVLLGGGLALAFAAYF